MYCLICGRYSGLKPLHVACEQAIHSYEEEIRFREEEKENENTKS
jgi:hypothetical protein